LPADSQLNKDKGFEGIARAINKVKKRKFI